MSLRHLAVSVSRARPSVFTPSAFAASRHARPQSFAEIRTFESLLQLRWNSDVPNNNGSQKEPIAGTSVNPADEGNDSSIHAPVTRGYRHISFREGESGEARGPQPRPANPTKVIYVGNLKYETTEQELEERFSEFGEVIGVRIPRSSDQGVARGCVRIVSRPGLCDANPIIQFCIPRVWVAPGGVRGGRGNAPGSVQRP